MHEKVKGFRLGKYLRKLIYTKKDHNVAINCIFIFKKRIQNKTKTNTKLSATSQNKLNSLLFSHSLLREVMHVSTDCTVAIMFQKTVFGVIYRIINLI